MSVYARWPLGYVELTAKSNCSEAGRVRGEGIVTHTFSLDQYGDALGALSSSDCLKAVVIPES
jgi:hypothetical protein